MDGVKTNIDTVPQQSDVSQDVYSWTEPNAEGLHIQDHFSSLLFGGSVLNTVLEVALLVAPFAALTVYGYGAKANELNVEGSMPFQDLAVFHVACALLRRVYNAYLEAVFFSFPKLRTQPPKAHRLKNKRDLMGRDWEQLDLIDFHDKLTIVSQFVLDFGLYFLLPGYYPPLNAIKQTFRERFIRLILNHYVMSFGMYWAHRSLHINTWLWDNIHSFHHFAKHPLSRNTYEDHWVDNFANAIVGHVFAQILVPLDRPTFFFSRVFRILESLEKHSGVSCSFNLAHSLQQWLPFAQMPHHHDWHHEGFKGSNYTFSSIGGLWDCLFGTRKAGRYSANNCAAATREDIKSAQGFKTKVKELPSWFSPLYPLVFLGIAVVLKLTS